jgi:hypothetical protein
MATHTTGVFSSSPLSSTPIVRTAMRSPPGTTSDSQLAYSELDKGGYNPPPASSILLPLLGRAPPRDTSSLSGHDLVHHLMTLVAGHHPRSGHVGGEPPPPGPPGPPFAKLPTTEVAARIGRHRAGEPPPADTLITDENVAWSSDDVERSLRSAERAWRPGQDLRPWHGWGGMRWTYTVVWHNASLEQAGGLLGDSAAHRPNLYFDGVPNPARSYNHVASPDKWLWHQCLMRH